MKGDKVVKLLKKLSNFCLFYLIGKRNGSLFPTFNGISSNSTDTS